MAEVVVVGAGLGGLASAVRLAKLGHTVTVHERTDSPGGLLRRVRAGGCEWDARPAQIPLPAVVRDLFHSTGRPLERLVDLALCSPARRYLFSDGNQLDLPTGSRADQLAALSQTLGDPAATEWTRFVDALADQWQLMRAAVLDQPAGLAGMDRRTAAATGAKVALDRRLSATLTDPRLLTLARATAAGLDPIGSAGRGPGSAALQAYVERSFGVWQPVGESTAAALARALLTRTDERRVDIRWGSEVSAVSTTDNRVHGVVLADGTKQPADVVVTACDPATALAMVDGASRVRRLATLFAADPQSARSITQVHVSASDRPAALTRRDDGEPVTVLVSCGDPVIEVRLDHRAAGGHDAEGWAVLTDANLKAGQTAGPDRSQGSDPDTGPDTGPLAVLANRGIDLRAHPPVRTSVLPTRAGWRGLRTATKRAGCRTPLPGLFCLGVDLSPAPTVATVAWEAAHVATLVGPAPRTIRGPRSDRS